MFLQSDELSTPRLREYFPPDFLILIIQLVVHRLVIRAAHLFHDVSCQLRQFPFFCFPEGETVDDRAFLCMPLAVLEPCDTLDRIDICIHCPTEIP